MRRLPLVLAGLLVVAAGAYAGYWFYFARAIERGLGPWAVAQRDKGYDIAWRSVAVGGFPFAFRLDFADVSIGASRPTPYRATSGTVVATAAPFAPDTWHIAAPEGASIDAPALLSGLAAGTLTASVAPGRAANVITFAAGQVSGRGLAAGFTAATLGGQLTLPARAPADHRGTALAVTASVGHAVLPAGRPVKTIDALALALELRGALPPGPLVPALTAWRDNGGTLEVESAHVESGGTTLDLAGTLALDQALQPEGALTASVAGADKAVDAIVAAGGIEARYAAMVKSVLRAISSPDDSRADRLRLPLTIEDQRLYVGPAEIAVLPRLSWR